MHWRTRLVQPQSLAPADFKSLTVPTYRASTVVFDRQEDVRDGWRQDEHGYTYGVYGTPTALELAARIAQLEGAHHTFMVPGGQAAIALAYLAVCGSGSHVLVPYSAYGPNFKFTNGMLARYGVTVEPYDPLIGAGIAELIRPETALVWTESPGSVTMEVQDIPAICQAAHARGVLVALDNTYAAGVLFDAFAHGVDISIQALTKYVGGHSDLLLGTVSVKSEALKTLVGDAHQQLGLTVSPDDCNLAIRGLQTLGLRLEKLEQSTLSIARWLAERREIKRVRHPALPSCPGHEFWQRDFSGSASVFSVQFDPRYSKEDVAAFINALALFKIGMSWGGVTSLAVSYPELKRPDHDYQGRLVRLNIGLEEPEDLLADLAQALGVLNQRSR